MVYQVSYVVSSRVTHLTVAFTSLLIAVVTD